LRQGRKLAREENKFNRYIRERIKEAREAAGISQDELAKVLYKTRVAISDLERGRVNVDASELLLIASYFQKPIGFFFPPYPTIQVKGELTTIEQELVMEFRELPETQQFIALEYVRQQRKMVEKATSRKSIVLDDRTE
jgi:transcriptional regulator with XRE-family HTH domain